MFGLYMTSRTADKFLTYRKNYLGCEIKLLTILRNSNSKKKIIICFRRLDGSSAAIKIERNFFQACFPREVFVLVEETENQWMKSSIPWNSRIGL